MIRSRTQLGQEGRGYHLLCYLSYSLWHAIKGTTSTTSQTEMGKISTSAVDQTISPMGHHRPWVTPAKPGRPRPSLTTSTLRASPSAHWQYRVRHYLCARHMRCLIDNMMVDLDRKKALLMELEVDEYKIMNRKKRDTYKDLEILQAWCHGWNFL